MPQSHTFKTNRIEAKPGIPILPTVCTRKKLCSKRSETILLNDTGAHIEKLSVNFKTKTKEVISAEEEKGEEDFQYKFSVHKTNCCQLAKYFWRQSTIESIIFSIPFILLPFNRGIDMELVLLLIIGGVIGFLGALLSLHGKVKKDVGYEQKHRELADLIERAKHEILIATDLDPYCFDNSEFLKCLSKAKYRGCNVKIVHDKRASLEDTPKLAKLQEKGVVSVKKYGKEIHTHFVVVDGQHVRLDRHQFQKYEQTKAQGRVLFRTLYLGRKYRRLFDEMWNP